MIRQFLLKDNYLLSVEAMLRPPNTHCPNSMCCESCGKDTLRTAYRKAKLLNSRTGCARILVENRGNQYPTARYGSTNGESQGGEKSWMGSVLGDDVPSEFTRVVHAEA